MNNPFKLGTLVEGEYFTDRVRELEYVKQVLNSENHLILISPRRYGKTSLVNKAAIETDNRGRSPWRQRGGNISADRYCTSTLPHLN